MKQSEIESDKERVTIISHKGFGECACKHTIEEGHVIPTYHLPFLDRNRLLSREAACALRS